MLAKAVGSKPFQDVTSTADQKLQYTALKHTDDHRCRLLCKKSCESFDGCRRRLFDCIRPSTLFTYVHHEPVLKFIIRNPAGALSAEGLRKVFLHGKGAEGRGSNKYVRHRAQRIHASKETYNVT